MTDTRGYQWFFADLKRRRVSYVLLSVLASLVPPAAAQDVEPRFMRSAPVGTSGLGLGYSYSTGAVLLNKTIPVENLDGDIHSVGAVYALFLDFWGMTGRVDAGVPLATGSWSGILERQDTTTSLTGFGDPLLRVAIFFLGAPALSPAEFGDYDPGTVVGAAFRVRVPLGQYDGDRVINLGTNRWSFSPRIGLSRELSKRWNVEAYSSAWFFTDNTDFFGGSTQSQAPSLSIQLHAEYSFNSGIWLAFSTRQVFGGETSLNGVPQGDAQNNNRIGLTLNLPISGHNVLRFAVTTGVKTSIGNDYTSAYAAWTYGWIAD